MKRLERYQKWLDGTSIKELAEAEDVLFATVAKNISSVLHRSLRKYTVGIEFDREFSHVKSTYIIKEVNSLIDNYPFKNTETPMDTLTNVGFIKVNEDALREIAVCAKNKTFVVSEKNKYKKIISLHTHRPDLNNYDYQIAGKIEARLNSLPIYLEIMDVKFIGGNSIRMVIGIFNVHELSIK